MFGRKKAAEPPKKRNRDLSQFGLFEIPDDFDPSAGVDDDGNDSDLEAELAAVMGGGGPKPKPQPRKKQIIPQADLDKLVAESLRDISDEELSEGDENDPNLLGELQELTGEEVTTTPPASSPAQEEVLLPTTTVSTIELLKSRLAMYQAAEAAAKSAGEASRARRFNRGLKTIQDMLKQATAGRTINNDDIPPEVFVKKPEGGGGDPPAQPQPQPPPVPARTAPAPPPTSPPPALPKETPPIVPTTAQRPEDPKMTALLARQHEYKVAALSAKKAGDTASAMEFVKVLKQFDMVIKAAKEGQEVDLSDMPPPPNELKDFLAKMQAAAQAPPAPEPAPAPAPVEPPPAPEATSEPTTLLEALQQRLDKYKSVEASAKAEGNSSKARRFGRIVKQYEDAIKMHKAGRPVPLDELPTPPGFGPLPTGDAPAAKPASPAAPAPTPAVAPKPAPAAPVTPPKPATPTSSPDKPTPPPKPSHEGTTRMSGNQKGTTLQEKQMAILTQRQQEFKLAAIEAKKAGEIEQAKEYLKIYKGFESVLNAASCGLPVDMNTLPIPPSQRDKLEDSFAFVNDDDCTENSEGTDSELAVRLEEQLVKQLMMCKNTRDHHKAMGDVAGMNRFENLALAVQKDLDLIRYVKRKNHAIPRFHYEQKSFNIVHCNTDLSDNEVEIVLVRGIQYNVTNPKDVDTYVKVEFPYPQDDTFKAKSNLVKDTDSPDYDQSFKVEIQRTNRQCQRVFKRHAVKFEVYSRGCCLGGVCWKFPMCCFSGFLRSDILIGTVNVKLAPLETKCEIHDSYDLMDGRKTVGGKLEVKVRLRNPIVAKQIEHINEKWLILDA